MSDQTSSCPDGSCPRTDAPPQDAPPQDAALSPSRSVQQVAVDFGHICEELVDWTDESLGEEMVKVAYNLLQTAYERADRPGALAGGLRELLLRAMQSSCQAAAADDAQDEDPVAPVPAAAPATNGAAAPA
jgi:hypothetical protein